MFTKRQIEVGNKRLLKLADILDAIPEKPNNAAGEPSFDMSKFYHPCRTPACALGWWAAHNPRRWRSATEAGSSRPFPALKALHPDPSGMSDPIRSAIQEFALENSPDYWDLFGGDGMGDARRPKTAAKWLRRWVAKRRAKA